VLLLLLFVLVVAVLDRFRHRRNGRRRAQHQIEAKLLRAALSLRGGHDLGDAGGKDRTNFPCADRFINVLSAILPARRKISRWIHAMDCF